MKSSNNRSGRRRWTSEQRQKFLADFHQTKMTRREFANGQGVGLSTLVNARCLVPVLAAFALSGWAAPVEITPVQPVRIEARGNLIFADFGSDAYGSLELEFPSAPQPVALKVRLGEKLDAGGAIDRHPPGSVNFQECTLNAGPKKQHYRIAIPPRRHSAPVNAPPEIGEITPFRYVEIEGPAGALRKIKARQLFVHAPFNDQASDFASSDRTLDAVWQLCKHTVKATTAFGVYIDGNRERTPYEGDCYINLLSHYACDLDPRVARATWEYLLQHPTWPTEWSLIMPMIACEDYLATGEPVLVAGHYDAIKAKLIMGSARPDGLLQAAGIVDWPAKERDGYNDGVPDPREKRQVGPEVNTVVNAYYYKSLRSMAQLAAAVNRQDEARNFEAKAAQVYQAFNSVFFDSARGIYRDGEGSSHTSLHANMFPLAFGLVPAGREARVADFVESRGMACGVYGAQFLLDGLYAAGRDDAALALMRSHDLHGWAHMLDLGSTMTMEAWDPGIKPNLTWNHAWGSAPANIIARDLLGVHPLKPGYSRIEIAPHPGDLKWMRGKVPTPHGPATIAWQSNPASLEIEIPAGSIARVRLPGSLGAGNVITINGRPANANLENGARVLDPLPSGHYLIR